MDKDIILKSKARRKTMKNETKRGKLERPNSAAIKYDNPYFIKCNYKVIGRS